MRLVRLAIVSLTPHPKQKPEECVIANADGVEVTVHAIADAGAPTERVTRLIARPSRASPLQIWIQMSSLRRDLWRPPAIITNEAGKGVLRQGSTPTVEFLLLDEFGILPRVLQIQHTNLPTDWWHRFVPGQ
jgi:hypothetical protein